MKLVVMKKLIRKIVKRVKASIDKVVTAIDDATHVARAPPHVFVVASRSHVLLLYVQKVSIEFYFNGWRMNVGAARVRLVNKPTKPFFKRRTKKYERNSAKFNTAVVTANAATTGKQPVNTTNTTPLAKR